MKETREKLQKVSWTALRVVNDAYINAWTSLSVLFISVFCMWSLNVSGLMWLNVPFAIAGALAIVFVGFFPKYIGHTIILSGFLAFLRQSKFSHELTSGLVWHYRIVIAAAYAFSLAAFTLITWSFAKSPGAFWIGFLGVLILLVAQQVHGIGSRWMPTIVSIYVTTCILVALWSTLGGAYSGRAFDTSTGEPAYMVDQTTGAIDGDGRTPQNCRPQGTVHDRFDYARQGTCFSAQTGQRLIPISAEQALRRDPSSWGSLAVQASDKWFWWIVGAIALLAALAITARVARPLSSVVTTLVPLIVLGCIGLFFAQRYRNVEPRVEKAECPKAVLRVTPGTHLAIPAHCNVIVDLAQMLGGFEYDFADSNLPVIDGGKRFHGHSVEKFVTHSHEYVGRKGYGMMFITNPNAFRDAGISEIVIEVQAPTTQ